MTLKQKKEMKERVRATRATRLTHEAAHIAVEQDECEQDPEREQDAQYDAQDRGPVAFLSKTTDISEPPPKPPVVRIGPSGPPLWAQSTADQVRAALSQEGAKGARRTCEEKLYGLLRFQSVRDCAAIDALLAKGMPAEADIPVRLRKRVAFWIELILQTTPVAMERKAARKTLRGVVQGVIRHKGGQ